MADIYRQKILLTGFEPFGGDEYNPSLAVAEKLKGTVYKDYEFVAAAVPVSRKKCPAAIAEALQKYNPAIILCTGLAGGRTAVSVERIAINSVDFPVPDEDGYLALNEKAAEDGPAAYFATLPIRAMVQEIRKQGIPAYVSNTAGTFNCNLVMYTALHIIAANKLNSKAGFIHLPYEPSMIAAQKWKMPSMSFSDMAEAVMLSARAAVDYEQDIVCVAGACD